ncbi:MAG: hypothetical protein J6P03_04555 [Opitutales bacterium]|nr:hypothetical protein [Opitutales bacterium]
MRKFAHIGIPSAEKRENMSRIDAMKLSVSSPADSKHSIEWLYFEYDCPMPKLLQTSTHIAYFVDDIESELKGANVLVPMSVLPDGTKLAFIVEEGVPIELLQPLV